jgi:hypothetical protein
MAANYFGVAAVTAGTAAAAGAAAVVVVPEVVVAAAAVADPAAAGTLAAAAAKPSSGPVRAPSGTVPLLAAGSVVTSWKSMETLVSIARQNGRLTENCTHQESPHTSSPSRCQLEDQRR